MNDALVAAILEALVDLKSDIHVLTSKVARIATRLNASKEKFKRSSRCFPNPTGVSNINPSPLAFATILSPVIVLSTSSLEVPSILDIPLVADSTLPLVSPDASTIKDASTIPIHIKSFNEPFNLNSNKENFFVHHLESFSSQPPTAVVPPVPVLPLPPPSTFMPNYTDIILNKAFYQAPIPEAPDPPFNRSSGVFSQRIDVEDFLAKMPPEFFSPAPPPDFIPVIT